MGALFFRFRAQRYRDEVKSNPAFRFLVVIILVLVALVLLVAMLLFLNLMPFAQPAGAFEVHRYS